MLKNVKIHGEVFHEQASVVIENTHKKSSLMSFVFVFYSRINNFNNLH